VKVLYLCNDPGIDLAGKSGGAIHIRSFVNALADLGHEVAVVTCSPSSCKKALESDLHATIFTAPLAAWNRAFAQVLRAAKRAVGRTPRRSPDAVRALHNLTFFKVAMGAAKQLNPDFIYERYSLWAVAGLSLAQKRSIPLVMEVNAPLAYEQQHYRAGVTCPPLARWVEGVIWRKARLLIAVSESLRSQLQRAGVKPELIHVLPNAVNTRLFHMGLQGSLVRERLKIDGRFVIGFVGTFKRWHGVDLLLAAFQDLHSMDPSAHLLLVGDGPLRPQFEEEVRKVGLIQAVTFAGGIAHEDVPHYLAAMDAAIAPYPAVDNFYYSPLKLFEYMAAGRAVVASRVGQVAEVVADGVTGLLFEPGDRAGLVGCLRRLRDNPALRKELGKNANAACSARTWNQNAAQLIDRVEPLLNPNHAWPRRAIGFGSSHANN
jgi:glycosyltransferase involved in cell wall biosynthesis